MRKFFLSVFLVSSILFAQEVKSSFPSLEPYFDSGDVTDQLECLQVIRYGLLFSDCAEGSSQWSQSLEKFNSILTKIQNPQFASQPDKVKAEKILSVMYENLLTQYQDRQTRLDVMFENGTYNCVSSSLLYLALAKACGLKVGCIKTPTHAFCTVTVGEEVIDVETTNPFGFNPGRTQVLEQSGQSKKYAVIPKKYYADRRAVSERTFVSLTGANMSSFWMSKNDWQHCIPMAATVMQFREGQEQWEKDDGRDCFDTVAMNYAVVLDKSGKYVESVQWVDKVIEKYGMSEKVRGELNGGVYNAVCDLCNLKDFETAEAMVESHCQFISENFNFQCRKNIFLSRVQAEFEGKESQEALEIVREKYASPLSGDKGVRQTLDKWQEFYWVEKVNGLNKSGKYLEAYAACEEGLKAMPNNYAIKNAGKSAMYNHDVVIHNEMAKLANVKQYDRALELIEKGLVENPSSLTLQNDKKRLLQMMNR